MLEGELEGIRAIIHNYSIIERRQPTWKGTYNKIITSGIDFQGGLTTLSNVIKKMGFIWRKTTDNRKVLHESFGIRLKRIQYLKQLQVYTNENRAKIYTDESYIHSSHTQPKGWSDNSKNICKKPISKGQHAIMVHAGGEDGFIPNALLIFESGTKFDDYHDDMNHKNFMQWITTKLLPNLPPKSILIVDNASYHNVRINKDPTSATKKTYHMIPNKQNRNYVPSSNKRKQKIFGMF